MVLERQEVKLESLEQFTTELFLESLRWLVLWYGAFFWRGPQHAFRLENRHP
jgi:hypothetical protein